MKFTPLRLPGAFRIELEPISDERGFFARSWCEQEFTAQGLNPHIMQCSISFNQKKGTLRGMHYQAAPHEEAKLVRCTQGAIYDVLLDLRADSPTYCRWAAEELSAENRRMLYIPEGVAHGFQTLTDNAEVFYQISEFYHGELSRGVRWNDPAFGIAWPDDTRTISERDRQYQDFQR
jgi:dTDP-4-dehydrorhamnose 3,5-epimerase